MLNYVSANRDEAVFADPFAFDPDRAKNQQIAFGFGAHVCLGQHLARMEMRILMEELLPRLKRVELAVEPARSEEHTSELQSLKRPSYAAFTLKKNKNKKDYAQTEQHAQ